MKSTIKLDGLRAVVVTKAADKTARIELVVMGAPVGSMNLTADQAGAFQFALDRIFEEHETEARREAGQGA